MARRARHVVTVRVLAGCRGRVTAAELRRVARAVMQASGVATEVGVEVVLADSGTVRDLNRLYRGLDEPTDVLSFASTDVAVAFPATPEEAPTLGEVVVCVPVAEAQATERRQPVAAEIGHLLVHGLLHILGYDHEEPFDAARMKAREDELLLGLGYEGQYQHGH